MTENDLLSVVAGLVPATSLGKALSDQSEVAGTSPAATRLTVRIVFYSLESGQSPPLPPQAVEGESDAPPCNNWSVLAGAVFFESYHLHSGLSLA
jgi:hypothetical protein